MFWWNLPNNTSLAFIPRSGSTALAKAILTAYFPEKLEDLKKCHLPEGMTEAPAQFFVPSSIKPEGEVYVLLRDPIERFKSGCTKIDCDVDSLISDLESGRCKNIHVSPVYKLLKDIKCKIFKFPDDIEKLSKILGIKVDIENVSLVDKPILTSDQIRRLEVVYTEDFILFNKI